MSCYVIFEKLPSRQAISVETAVSLADAKKRWHELRQMFSGDYFILDFENAVFIVPADSLSDWPTV